MTHEQARILKAIKAAHGKLLRIPDDSLVGEQLLSECISESYVFQCSHCHALFTIDPDGEVTFWMPS